MIFKQFCATTLCLAGIISPLDTTADDRALIIGINAYPGDSALEGCKTDAENMYQFIQEVWNYKPQQIKMLTDEAATRQAILATFDDWLINGSQPGDRILFYYSGHGSTLADNNSDEGDGIDEVLCPIDSVGNDQKSRGANMLRDDDINTRLRQLPERQVIFISDSCHSGTITRSLDSNQRKSHTRVKRLIFPDQPRLKPQARSIGRPEPANNFAAPLNNVIAYSAVAPNQKALDGGPRGGIFTNLFIKAIRDKAADRNSDGKITHAEVLDYVRLESQSYCKKTGNCADNPGQLLTPQLDVNPKWLSTEVTAKEATPPPPTSSPEDTMAVAQVVAGENPAQLKTQMLPSTRFQLGENMQISINSQHPGYLFVLDIDSTGKLTVLFPNEYSVKQNRKGVLQIGQTVTIPDDSYGFEFKAQEPTGKGLLLTLLIEEEETFIRTFQQQLPMTQRGFGVVEKTSQVQTTLQKLHQQLHQTILTPEGGSRPINWSMVSIEYEIR